MLTIKGGKAFIKLENFSTPYRNAFKQANKNFGYYYIGDQVASGQLTSNLFAPSYRYLTAYTDQLVFKPTMDPQRTYEAQYVNKEFAFTRSKNSNKNIQYFAQTVQTREQKVVSELRANKVAAGAAAFVELINEGLSSYINISKGSDQMKLNNQLFGRKYLDFEQGPQVDPGAFQKAFSDVQRAFDEGLLSDDIDISLKSQIMNVVLYGGDGTESKKVLEAGRAIIRKYSSQEAKNRLIMTEMMEQFEMSKYQNESDDENGG